MCVYTYCVSGFSQASRICLFSLIINTNGVNLCFVVLYIFFLSPYTLVAIRQSQIWNWLVWVESAFMDQMMCASIGVVLRQISQSFRREIHILVTTDRHVYWLWEKSLSMHKRLRRYRTCFRTIYSFSINLTMYTCHIAKDGMIWGKWRQWWYTV